MDDPVGAANGNFFAICLHFRRVHCCLVTRPKSPSAPKRLPLGMVARSKTMTSARLRLVDEAKGKATNGAAPASEAPASKARALRGPRAQSEVVARAPAAKPRAGKR